MPIVAAAIDLVAQANYSQNGVFAVKAPLWEYGGNLYAIGLDQTLTPDDAVGIWKSTDAGSSWSQMDSGGQPTLCASVANCVVGRYVYALIGSTADPFDVPMRMFVFDCGTDTWTQIGSGGPTGHWASSLSALSNGDLVYVYGEFGADNLIAGVFSGGGWGGGANIRTAVGVALSGWNCYAATDDNDLTHLFFQDPSGFPSTCYYISVDAGGTLGTPQTLSGVELVGTAACGQNVVACSCSVGGQASVIIGSPLSAPVFSTVTVDSSSPMSVALTYDPSTDVWGFSALTTSLDQVYAGTSPDLLTWTVSLFYDINTDPTPPGLSISFGLFPMGMYFDQDSGDLLLGSNYRDTLVPGLFVVGFYIGNIPVEGGLSNDFY